jgi:hypothetical protein
MPAHTFALRLGKFAVFPLALMLLAAQPGALAALTGDEMKALVENARKFTVSARKLRITEAERDIVRRKDPKIHESYSSDKEGRVALEWGFSEGKYLIVTVEGDLLGADKRWSVRIFRADSGTGGEENAPPEKKDSGGVLGGAGYKVLSK